MSMSAATEQIIFNEMTRARKRGKCDQEKQAIIKALEAIANALSFCDTDMELVMRDRIDAIYAAIDELRGDA